MLNSRLALGRIAEDGGNNSAKLGKWHYRASNGSALCGKAWNGSPMIENFGQPPIFSVDSKAEFEGSSDTDWRPILHCRLEFELACRLHRLQRQPIRQIPDDTLNYYHAV